MNEYPGIVNMHGKEIIVIYLLCDKFLSAWISCNYGGCWKSLCSDNCVTNINIIMKYEIYIFWSMHVAKCTC